MTSAGKIEILGVFALAVGERQGRIRADTRDPRTWQRIREAIETLGSLNLDFDDFVRDPDGSYRYGIDLVGHRVEYVFDGP